MQRMRLAILVFASTVLAIPFAVALGHVQDASRSGASEAAQDDRPVDPERALIEDLMEQVASLRQEIQDLREELAEAKLREKEARRELEELRQFIEDNREYGDDFEQYREIRQITERMERQKALERARERRQQQLERRRQEQAESQAATEAQEAEAQRLERYRQAGFQHLGLDIFLGRTGFFYQREHRTGFDVEYEPFLGDFLEPTIHSQIDFSEMTISGTVLNASEQVQNIGIAIAFFDARGNQVGAETVQINNARPNVPYPFTSKVEMALDRPFASSTSWVLYADAVQTGGGGGAGQ